MSNLITDADIAGFISNSKRTSFESEYTDVKTRLISKPFNPSDLMPGSTSILEKAGLNTNQKINFLNKRGMSLELATMKVNFPTCT
jgi:hypothetical protein